MRRRRQQRQRLKSPPSLPPPVLSQAPAEACPARPAPETRQCLCLPSPSRPRPYGAVSACSFPPPRPPVRRERQGEGLLTQDASVRVRAGNGDRTQHRRAVVGQSARPRAPRRPPPTEAVYQGGAGEWARARPHHRRRTVLGKAGRAARAALPPAEHPPRRPLPPMHTEAAPSPGRPTRPHTVADTGTREFTVRKAPPPTCGLGP